MASSSPDHSIQDDLKPVAEHRQDFLERMKTAQSISMSPEIFEQLYLAPQNRVKGNLRQTFGNPTPIALGGFLLCTTPLSMALLGWQGAGGLGAANVGSYFYVGGLALVLGSIGEWILGNTFPATLFMIYGGFFLTFGATLVPAYNAYGFYSPDPSNPMEGMNSSFYATFSFFLVAMTIVSTIFLIATLRTNICFFVVFLIIIPCLSCLAGSFFALAQGKAAYATKLQHIAAVLLLTISIIGFYIEASLVLASVDFPIALPLGDLSTVIKGGQERAEAKNVEAV